MQFDPTLWGLIKDAGFAGLCIFLLWWVMQTTDKRELSFRAREEKFLTLMECYQEQLRQFNKHLDDITRLIAELTTRLEEMSKREAEANEMLHRALERRMGTKGGD